MCSLEYAWKSSHMAWAGRALNPIILQIIKENLERSHGVHTRILGSFGQGMYEGIDELTSLSNSAVKVFGSFSDKLLKDMCFGCQQLLNNKRILRREAGRKLINLKSLLGVQFDENIDVHCTP